MHDSLLMQNISSSIKSICEENGIKKISLLEISVNDKSHINENNLLEHLMDLNGEVVDTNTNVKVIFENLPDEVAQIMKVEGEK